MEMLPIVVLPPGPMVRAGHLSPFPLFFHALENSHPHQWHLLQLEGCGGQRGALGIGCPSSATHWLCDLEQVTLPL